MQAAELLLERQIKSDNIPIHKLLDPRFFLHHRSISRKTELVPGPQQIVAIGDSIALGEDDLLTQEMGRPTIGLPAGSVVAYGVEQATPYSCNFANIAFGGDAVPAIRERLPEKVGVFEGYRNTALVSAGINNLGQKLLGDPEAFEIVLSIAHVLDREERSFSPKIFRGPKLFYNLLNETFGDVHGLFQDILKINNQTRSIDQIAVIGSYDFGLMDQLSVDLKTVPQSNREGVRSLILNNNLIRKVTSFVSRMNNNLLAMAIERAESEVPPGQRPHFLLLNTFSRLKREDINLHPTEFGRIEIGKILLERMMHEGRPLVSG